ncbi:HNH endonuclease [Bradyrhizobium sp. USDA 3262]
MVRLFVAVTDKSWFDQLSASAPHDEVNFWQPSGTTQFRALQPGELFLFKLHAPNNFIVGGGIFGHASIAPLSLAWDAFGLKNGVSSRAEMRARIGSYRRDPITLDDRQDPVIGCRILTQPFFWSRDLWLPVPEGWSPNIVTGKGFSTEERDGQYLWSAVTDRLTSVPGIQNAGPIMAERFGKPTLIKPRLGQGAFRLTITDSYERRCAVYRIHVSEALLSMNDGPMFEYGLKAMAGQLIKLPSRSQDYPDRDRLAERFSQFELDR